MYVIFFHAKKDMLIIWFPGVLWIPYNFWDTTLIYTSAAWTLSSLEAWSLTGVMDVNVRSLVESLVTSVWEISRRLYAWHYCLLSRWLLWRFTTNPYCCSVHTRWFLKWWMYQRVFLFPSLLCNGPLYSIALAKVWGPFLYHCMSYRCIHVWPQGCLDLCSAAVSFQPTEFASRL